MKKLLAVLLLLIVTACGTSSPCCKICTQGKACGDTCIAANKTCNTPGGCACNSMLRPRELLGFLNKCPLAAAVTLPMAARP